MRSLTFIVLGVGLALFGGLLVQPASAELKPDQLLLVVNRNIPEGRALAEYYAEQRHVPAGRIVELPLPVGEQMPLDVYEEDAVAVIREFLIQNNLADQVKCLVTFYGVPLRIQQRRLKVTEQQELGDLNAQLHDVTESLAGSIAELESLAAQAGNDFTPGMGVSLQQLVDRFRLAITHLVKHWPSIPADQQADVAERTSAVLERMEGYAAVIRFDREIGRNRPAEERAARIAELQPILAQIPGLSRRPWDADSRRQLREVVEVHGGLFALLNVIRTQMDYLSPEEGMISSVDNELALLWWPSYQRLGFMRNPLHYSVTGQLPPTLMVMRLDASSPEIVRQMLVGGFKAEKEGLVGPVVLDSRGLAPQAGGANGGYADYDVRIRNLATFLKEKTTLKVITDNTGNVFPADSVPEMALYCGWYSVRKYVPAFEFIRPGAIGFHVASFELISLRMPGEQGWVANLLRDGVSATLGPVAEPYLSAFPNPEDFFPLLLTGQYTLAEVYWRTSPMVSWRMSMVGDPLYKPYAANPALNVEDLPEHLRPQSGQ